MAYGSFALRKTDSDSNSKPDAKLYYAEHVHIARLHVVTETQSILVKVLNCVHYLYCRFEIFEVTRKITWNIAFLCTKERQHGTGIIPLQFTPAASRKRFNVSVVLVTSW